MLKSVSSITNAIGALNFKGTWNAATNTPTIVSGVGVKGDYFVVSVAGSTTIDGISNWGIGDWIVYNGNIWQRVEGGADLNGVNLTVTNTTTLSGLTASTALALDASKNVVSVANTGTGDNVLATSPTLVTPILGTPQSGTLTNATGLPLSTGVTGTLPVANGGTGATTSTGSGAVVLATSPSLVTPVLGTPTSGTLSSCTVDGTDAVGFRNTPVNSQSADYTLVLADSGKTIFHPAADANDRTFTIPANSSVAYAVGTVLTFVNLSANDLTIAITTDTMYLAGPGTTGSRTLAEYGIASAVKLASTDWLISGNGLT